MMRQIASFFLRTVTQKLERILIYSLFFLNNNMTVTCHFYNEEYLLPWWLQHHKDKFEHGIMLNCGSTDKSVSIIKDICPKWEIINSKNKFFDIFINENQMYDLERDIKGWRICLNVTEFLLGDTHKVTDKISDIYIDSLTMVSTKEEEFIDPKYDVSLLKQRTHGIHPETVYSIYEHKDTKINHTDCTRYRSEFYRRMSRTHNMYPTGRHYERSREFIKKPIFSKTPDFLIAWYNYSPFTESIINRKLQFKNKILPDDKYFPLTHYIRDSSIEKQIENLRKLQGISEDLFFRYSHLL